MGFNIKDYTLVKDRLISFRDDHKGCSITTELLNVNNIIDSPTGDMCNEYVIKATIIPNPLQEPEIYFTGLAAERDNTGFVNKSSAIENCETSAVGRALAFAGYGGDVQFASAEEVANAKITQSKSALTGDLLELMDNLFNLCKNTMSPEEVKVYNERRGAGYYDTKTKWKKSIGHFMLVLKDQNNTLDTMMKSKVKEELASDTSKKANIKAKGGN